MALFLQFLRDGVRAMFTGDRTYFMWLGFLGLLIGAAAIAYLIQVRQGLVVTGMSDQVSWGFYISNFAFLVGIAAAAVLLVIPAYIFHRDDIKSVVLIGEGLAVAAVVSAMSFVIVDIGRPDRLLHMIPGIGRFNWPQSMLAWDVLVLNGYLALNLAIPCYVHFCHYRGRQPLFKAYFPFVVLSMFWAISIHTVTAFLFAASSARPFWHIALLAPRFIATAFVSGPALIIIVLQLLRRSTRYPVPDSVIDTLSLIMAVALQISLFFVGGAVHGFLQRGCPRGVGALPVLRAGGAELPVTVRLDRAGDERGGGDRSVRPPPAPAAALAECGLRARLRRHLDREGHGLRGAGFHPDAPRRGLRIQPDGAGADTVRRHLGDGYSRLHAAGAGQHRDLPR
jgi:formate-dependent nitrite reductase membrane component NrfD